MMGQRGIRTMRRARTGARTRQTAAAAALAMGIGFVGCGGGQAAAPPPAAPAKCEPQHITVSVLASPMINPTDEGSARPVVVRVYQLKGDTRLYNATFEQIWHEDKTTLADDLVKVDEVQAYPATRKDLKFDRAEGVEYVAAVALFHNPKGKTWYTTFDLPPLPEPGKCNTCEDEDCTERPVQNAELAYWIDGSKVDDGVDHLDQFPAAGGPMKKKAKQ
ncbi:type VI secretion system lipoprotein TssJ [Pendulispora albinea]|uniref:Type VI secretion system lipoprotein TssJ n=1 Tax=Pendulispora albinea TaxID=2741071 RepID=A0ABZ2LNM9_9BACT